MLLLSSYNRMYRYLGTDDQDKTTTYRLKRNLNNIIHGVSAKIEKYLGYDLQIQSRTEYHDVNQGRLSYYMDALPISSVTSVYEDSTGLYTGSESELTATYDFYTGTEDRSIVLTVALPYEAQKGLRVIYTGGLAYDGVKSTVTVSDASQFTAGYFVNGGTSDALGIVDSTSSGTSLVIENLYGIFTAESLTEYSDEDLDTASGITDTITSVDRQSLAESYPNIVMAAEMEIRYHYKHKFDYEDTGMVRDGTDTRRDRFRRPESPFLEEVMQLLQPYRRYGI